MRRLKSGWTLASVTEARRKVVSDLRVIVLGFPILGVKPREKGVKEVE